MTNKRTDPLAKTKRYDKQNAECAAIIQATPQLNLGLIAEWAAMVLERQTPTVTGPLFRSAA